MTSAYPGSAAVIATTVGGITVQNTSLSTNLTVLSIEEVLLMTIYPVMTVGKYIHIVWYTVGFVGNLMSAKIWNAEHMYNVCSSAHYLVTISICDIICQFLHVFYYVEFFWRFEPFNTTTLCEFWSLLYMIPLYISELLVLGFTAEKYVSLRNPFRTGWFSRHQRAPKEIVWIITSVTVFSFPQSYFWRVDNKRDCDQERITDRLENSVWIWLSDSFIYFFIPTVVIVLNFLIIRRAKHSIISVIPKHQLHKEVHVKITEKLRESTKVLLALSFFRIFTLLPSTIVSKLQHMDDFQPAKLPKVYTLQDVANSPEWQRYTTYSAIKLSLEMIAASRLAFSLLIYCVSSIHFRLEFLRHCQNLKDEFVRTMQTIYSYLPTLRTSTDMPDVDRHHRFSC